MQKPFFKKNYANEKLVIEKIIKKLKKKKINIGYSFSR